MIRIPATDTRENYLSAYWAWVEMLAAEHFDAAVDALWRADPASHPDPTKFRERILTFFGGDKPWEVVIPNARLVDVLEDMAEVKLRGDGEFGWMMVQIPLTNEPDRAMEDDLLLMGLATSFFVRPLDGEYVLDFEMFHL